MSTLGVGCEPNKAERAAGLTKVADGSLAKGQPREAIVLYQRARALAPSAAIERGLGFAYAQLGDFAQALGHLQRSQAAAPDTETLSVLALAHAGLGDLTQSWQLGLQAAQTLRSVAQLPPAPLAALVLAAVAQSLEQSHEPFELLGNAIKDQQARHRPIPAEVLIALSEMRELRGEPTSADQLHQIESSVVFSVPLAQGLADAFRNGHKPLAAQRLLRALLRRDAKQAGAWLRLADLSVSMGDRATAVEAIAHVPVHTPELAAVSGLRARVLLLDHKAKAACDVLAQALGEPLPSRSQPDRDPLWLMRAGCLGDQNDLAGARAVLQALIAQHASVQTSASLMHAELCIRMNDPNAAIESVHALQAGGTHEPRASYWLGRAYELQHQDEPAQKAFEAYLRELGERRDADALVHLALSFRRQGDVARARSVLNSALDASPGAFDALQLLAELLPPDEAEARVKAEAVRAPQLDSEVLLGEIAVRAKQPAQAETHYRSALAKNPDDVTVITSLAGLLASHGRASEAITLLQEARTRVPASLVLAGSLAAMYEG
ncbi:MAG TPA: tetratricopeptide repeat protein, partial [Polyangiales bacterium]|nr:tetratricopeptide repeat protein [Polyangiales bacterium]